MESFVQFYDYSRKNSLKSLPSLLANLLIASDWNLGLLLESFRVRKQHLASEIWRFLFENIRISMSVSSLKPREQSLIFRNNLEDIE